MQQNTKQRILGTVVLLAFCLIFLPIIFDGEGSYEPILISRIPDPPQINILPEPQQVRPIIIADSDALDNALSNDLSDRSSVADQATNNSIETLSLTPEADTITEAAVPESTLDYTLQVSSAPQLGGDGLPSGWSVRMGLFSNVDNAAKLRERLQEAGYRAYTREIESTEGQLRGVFVGPWLDKQVSAAYRSSLQEEFLLEGIVVPYEMER